MGIATPTIPPLTSHSSLQFLNKQNFSNSMSQDYHQGIFSFSNGFETSQQQQQQQHIAQQIRRDKLRVQGFEPPPPPMVGMAEEEPSGLPGYETAGMLSEMFNFPSGGVPTATELLESQILHSYRNPRAAPTSSAADWFTHRQGVVVGGELGDSKNQTVVNDTGTTHHHDHHPQQHQISRINADSAAAMQLFLMNPQQQQQQQQRSSSSPSHSNPPPPQSTSSTLHMLLPNHPPPPPTLQALPDGGFGQFSWLRGNENNPNEIPGVVEGQGLSLSLSSHLEAAKADELRIGEGGMLFFGSSPAAQYQFKNLGSGGALQNHQLHVGVGSSYGSMNMLRNSKYTKAAQELLEEFCSVGRGQFKKNKIGRQNNNNGSTSSAGATSGGGGGVGAAGNSSSSSKDVPPLSAADRLEHQRRKVKLLSMLDEVDRRYNHYCEQMQMVVNSFDMLMGFGAAMPYTSLAQKAMSRHFRCLKDAIAAQLKHSCEMLGDKDAGTSGVTKGETPRLKILEQSLRQQRAFHQMGMMEQEAWRPQRGLPERSVNILRAWLFEHFLHPYPSDADKHLLARQTGLSRNQVSNWFINARVRLWKPMVEEMYQQEAKDEEAQEEEPHDRNRDQTSTSLQTPVPPNPTSTITATATVATTSTPPPPGKKSKINAPQSGPSFISINTQRFTDNRQQYPSNNASLPTAAASATLGTSYPAASQPFPVMHEPDMCRNHPPTNADMESTFIRFGASAGDVSLTLGLRHAGNLPEKSSFSVRDFGGC